MQKHSLFVSSLRFVNFLVYLALCKLRRVKIIWTVHNVVAHDRRGSLLETWVARLLLRFSDRVTALNQHIRQSLAKRYRFADVDLMRQGLYLDCYPDKVTREEARQHLDLDEKDFVLLFFGGVAEYKGIDVAIEALDLVADDSVKLFIVGQLDKTSSYAEHVLDIGLKNKNVKFFSHYIPDDEVQVFFKAADYTIYPYRRIDNSGTLYLTLAFGVPTIMRGSGGVPEVVSLNPNIAVLLDRSDKHEIAKAIETARNRKIQSSEFSVFRKELSWENLEAEIVSCFDKVQNR